jgi:hypothetical protein
MRSVRRYGFEAEPDAISLAERADVVLGGAWTVELVPLDRVVATEGRVAGGAVEAYAEEREWEQRRVDVLERGARYYILDGHHRAAAAVEAGADEVRANVYGGRKTL